MIDVVVKNLTSPEIIHAESTALFSIDNAREILETRDLKKLALSSNWGPRPIWADFVEEYQHVNFGEHFKAHLERLKLTFFFFYFDKEEDLQYNMGKSFESRLYEFLQCITFDIIVKAASSFIYQKTF